MSPTTEEITTFFDSLDADCAQNTPDGEWTFANGDAVFVCTHSARRVAAHFNGRVVGFDFSANRRGVMGEDQDGHDFALLNEHLVVDYWAARIAGSVTLGVFDLNRPEDRETVERLYGSPENWHTVASG